MSPTSFQLLHPAIVELMRTNIPTISGQVKDCSVFLPLIFSLYWGVMNIAARLDSIFSEDGTLSTLPHFEFRPQQRAMALAIAGALEKKEHLIIEAPTGVGKSLAYLIPAILHAVRENRKAIISTHTKNLQEQLFKKDLEIVRTMIGRDFDAVVFKGRRNYLCTTRLRNALHQQRQLFDTAESEELLRIKEWSETTRDGDAETLPFTPTPSVWQQVCSEKGACSTGLCGSQCFFQKAKIRAREASVVIMNHALFFTLFAMQDSEEFFLYKDDFVIFDEAHTLEAVAGLGIGKSISRTQVMFAIHRLYNPKTKKGLIAKIRVKHYRQLCEDAEEAATAFFDEVQMAANALGPRSNTLRIRTPRFVTDTVSGPLHNLQKGIKELEEDEKTKISKEELAAAKRLVWEAEVLIQEFLAQPDAGMTYWVEISTGRYPNVQLHAAPTSIADSIAPKLFKNRTSVIMTSATLSVSGSLEYFQQRLGASSAGTIILDTPFNFRKQMRVAIARPMPPPDDPLFEESLPGWIHRSVARSQGKALVLFTSAVLLRKVALQIRERLESDGLKLLVQDGKQSRHALLEEFKSDVHSVLFGLDSFWMGVDVPGEALEHVIITRLPFAVPDHPLIESRMELIAKRNGNAFFEFTLPEAVLKFRQGVGRLIRSKTDIGMITILDSRVLSKQYGRAFLQSIPRCPVEILTAQGVEELEAYN